MENYLIYVATIYIFARAILDLHQIKFIDNYKITRDESKILELNIKEYDRYCEYNKEKLYLSLVRLSIEAIIIYFIILFDGIVWIVNVIDLKDLTVANNYLLLLIFLTSIYLIKIPVSYFGTFYIEDKFGFNSMNKRLFLKDIALTYVMTIFVALIAFYFLDIVYNSFRDTWWLLFWLGFLMFNFTLIIIYPSLIAPIFNKFKKIDDIKLIDTVNDLSVKSNFKVDNIYVMDGSKRSKHSNAYFTGLFGKKRIVFFDTLLESLDYNEIKSVLAHEIGHYKNNHIQKSLFVSIIMSLVYFYSFYMFTINMNPNVENNYYIFYLAVMFIVVSPIILFFINPLLSSFSRKNEYEADNYAKMHSDSRALETSLLKLYKDNYSLVKSSPLYTFFYHTHPTVYERIIKLRKSETNE